MWAILRYAVFFIGGAFTGMIALCVVQSRARTDEMYFIERLKNAIISVLMWNEKEPTTSKSFPEKQLKEALNKDGL